MKKNHVWTCLVVLGLLGSMPVAAFARRWEQGPANDGGDGPDQGGWAPVRPQEARPQSQPHPVRAEPIRPHPGPRAGYRAGVPGRRQGYEARQNGGQAWHGPVNHGWGARQGGRQAWHGPVNNGWGAQRGKPAWGNGRRWQGQGHRVAAYGRAGQGQRYQSVQRGGRHAGWTRPAYNQVVARQQLARLGVHRAPTYITQRAQILRTDPAHSVIRFPSHGPGGRIVRATLISPQGSANGRVVAQMNVVNAPIWRNRVEAFDRDEDEEGHYYWHSDDGFNFCHYRDDAGFHWYGWYMGSQFFWTRHYDNRWWWYDTDQDRWDYYDDGHWWWQDPNHVGLVFCFNDGNYIPDYTAAAQPAPQASQDDGVRSVTSPDGSRTVKVMGGTNDAFLYDASPDPSFTPRYLASGVESVEYSDTTSGRPLEIILKLDDGTFDLFDSQGRPYGPPGDPADR